MSEKPTMDDRDIDALIEQCQSGDAAAQIEALLELTDAHARCAVPVILSLLTATDADVRQSAASALGRLGDEHVEQVGPALESTLADPEVLVRDEAIEALGLLRYAPAREALERVLVHDPEWMVRASAAWALGELGDMRSIEVLNTALDDAVEPVRAYAAHAIGLMGDASNLPVIRERLAKDSDPSTRAELLVAALRLGDNTALSELFPLFKTEDEEMAGRLYSTIDDLLSHRIPPILLERMEEFREHLAAFNAPKLLTKLDTIHELNTQSEWSLIAAWQAGNRAAGSELLERCYPILKRFFANKLDSDADIDDLIQTTLLACLRSLDRVHEDRRFTSHLLNIARNELFDYLRDRYKLEKREDIEELPVEDMAPGQLTITSQKREQRLLLKALRRIPLKDQIVFELYYWEELPALAIGAILNLTEPAVRGRLRLAKDRLRDAIAGLAEAAEELQSTSDNLEHWVSDVRSLISAEWRDAHKIARGLEEDVLRVAS